MPWRALGLKLGVIAVLGLIPVALAATEFSDPRGDVMNASGPTSGGDIVRVRVSNDTRSVTFEVTFARRPKNLYFLVVLLDFDHHRSGGHFWRDAELILETQGPTPGNPGFADAASAELRLQPNGIATDTVANVRDKGKTAWIRVPRRFWVHHRSDDGARVLSLHQVKIPRSFDFIVDAEGEYGESEHDPLVRDLAPNRGWHTYLLS